MAWAPLVSTGDLWYDLGPSGKSIFHSYILPPHITPPTPSLFPTPITPPHTISSSPHRPHLHPLPPPHTLQDPKYTAIKYGDVKRVTYDSIYGQGVVYNVIVMDTSTQATSAYIPRATYACDFYSEQGCDIRSEVIDKLLSPVIGLAGLFLCFLGQHFFDAG